MAKDPKLDLLRAIPLFADLSGRELERIARLVDEVDVPAGKVLMNEGDHGAEMFVVVEGRFTVERNGTVVRECGPGEILGELALLSEGPRTATVVAAEPGHLLVAGHHEFHELMEVSPEISAKMIDILARRVRSLDPGADA